MNTPCLQILSQLLPQSHKFLGLVSWSYPEFSEFMTICSFFLYCYLNALFLQPFSLFPLSFLLLIKPIGDILLCFSIELTELISIWPFVSKSISLMNFFHVANCVHVTGFPTHFPAFTLYYWLCLSGLGLNSSTCL